MARRSYFRLLSAACVTFMLLPNGARAAQDDLRPHVRANDRLLSQAIRDGQDQSATFRALLDRIDGLPGLVFLVSSRCGARESELPACLEHRIRTVAGLRFLRINIYPGESGARLIALIAHELEHAAEVLSEDGVTSQHDVEALLARIGRRQRSGSFETEAAQRTQTTVFREVRAHARGQSKASAVLGN